MSSDTAPGPEALAFRAPRAKEGCNCPICTYASSVPPYHSPFTQFKVVKWDASLGASRDPTLGELDDLNRQFPALAYSKTAADGGKIETPWVKACLKVVRTLKKMKIAGPFLHPVDPLALNIPDYPTIIKHPMDLSTVEAKLQRTESDAPAAEIGDAMNQPPSDDKYREPEEFASDMRLIFRNAFLYNKPELIVYKQAHDLSIKFETEYAKL